MAQHQRSVPAGTPFGIWLRQRRKALDLTQEQLAATIDVSLPTIVKIEAGQRRPSRQVAELLTRCLEVPPEEQAAFMRLARTPLSEGVSPVQGADRRGPTAVVRSVAKMDQARTGGTLLNQKLTPALLANDEGLDHLVQLVRAYFRLDGHHIQFNVVDADTLRAAQKNPEQYRSLIVRVAGYSDYFCDLSKALQEEIIARTAHEGF